MGALVNHPRKKELGAQFLRVVGLGESSGLRTWTLATTASSSFA